MIADLGEAQGVPFATFSPATKERAAALLPSYATIQNPLDVTGGVLSNFPLRYLIDARHMTAEGVLGKPELDIPTRILGLLLDECLDWRLAHKIPGHQVMTVSVALTPHSGV